MGKAPSPHHTPFSGAALSAFGKGGGLKLRLTGHGTGGWPEHSGGTTEGSQETAQTGLAGRGPGRCVCPSGARSVPQGTCSGPVFWARQSQAEPAGRCECQPNVLHGAFNPLPTCPERSPRDNARVAVPASPPKPATKARFCSVSASLWHSDGLRKQMASFCS